MKFWNWVEADDSDGRVLRFDGVIAQDEWWGDEITPAQFREELFAGSGPVTIWINSPGGSCVAASQIYAMLKDYKGDVTVKIDGCAYSAASVIAMAGTKVLMSPTALMMIHNPWSFAIGESEDMKKAAAMLDEVKEAIINAYEIKTGMGRAKISNLMDEETFLSAKRAIELGFADGMIEDVEGLSSAASSTAANFSFSQKAFNTFSVERVAACVRGDKGRNATPNFHNIAERHTKHEPTQKGVTAESLMKRLSLIQP
ncbi:MAG: Clp protease ClpP [Defluviitaleaceae bacterium]|nr:Clp protease ClpP [Defluviitaleaceae bacterium]